jgi:hypothetical protein
MASSAATKKLILVPALITLAVTLLRLFGELLHWSPALFSPAAGGGGAIVGIAWLVPVFGVYFALKLAAAGERPAGVGSAIGYAVLGIALVPLAGVGAATLGVGQTSLTMLLVFVVAALLGAYVAFRGWPGLGRTLLAYGLAARIPVVVIMLVAMLGNWGTHYDAPPPGFPEMGVFPKWFLIGFLPQLTIWIWFTMAIGGFLGGIAVAIRGRGGR